MKSQTLKEIGVLDSLRGFAACSVMVFHYVCTTTGYFTSDLVQSTFDVFRSGVHLFFVISGFILPWSMLRGGYTITKFFKFFLKRLCRLEPPYIVSVLTAIVLLFLRSRMIDHATPNLDAGRVAAHFFYLVPFFEKSTWLNEVYWSLAVEFQYYIFIALLFPLLMSKNVLIRIGLYLLCMAGPWLTGEAFLPALLPFFLMGITLFLNQEGIISKKEFLVVLLCCAIVGGLKSTVAASVFSLAGVLIINNWPDFKPILFSKLGKMSYSIYLFHPLIGGSLVNILSHRYTEPYQKVLVIVAGVMATLLSSAIVYYFVERPSKRLASSIKY